MTDPAREMAELLTELTSGNPNSAGDKYLAEKFDVKPWSQDFYRIIATIMDRLSFLKNIVQRLSLDADYRQEMVNHVDSIAQAFTPAAFNNEWHRYGATHLGPHNLQPLKSLSGLVRQEISYRKLSPDEVSEITAEVTELLEWLETRQLADKEFIRQALIDSLKSVIFRLERFRWLGWGYTLDSLGEVIGAYLILERQEIDANVNPEAAAILTKVGGVIKSVYGKLEKTKTAFETADWLLRAYGASTLLLTTEPAIRALLSSQ